MASYQFPPPETFNFQCPDEWSKWKRRFECFRNASGLVKEDEVQHVSALLYCMEEPADNVLTSTKISTKDRQKYASVVGKFDDYFKVCRNVILERARFNRRNQLPGESAEQYITTLYSLVSTCEYGGLTDQLLRDRLVVGIRDTALSERLQMDAELDLEKAKKMIRQREAVKDHHQLLQDGKRSHVDEARKKSLSGKKTGTHNPAQGGGKTQPDRQPCKRCGKHHSSTEKCLAHNATCYKCQRKGHFSSQCLTKSAPTDELTTETVNVDQFLGVVSSNTDSAWLITVQLEDKGVTFKLDTGAEVTAISEEAYYSLKRVTLQQACKSLFGPTHNAIQVLGQFQGKLRVGDRTSTETVFVIRGLRNNLLGLPAIKSLQLVCRVDTVCSEQEIQQRFPKVFSGLGTLGEPYVIKLKADAKPYALITAKNVPIPLRDKVRDELERMESIGVIAKVTAPTQ